MSWYYVGEGLSNLVIPESILSVVRRRLEYYKWFVGTSIASGLGLGFYSWLGNKLLRKDVEFARRRGRGKLLSALKPKVHTRYPDVPRAHIDYVPYIPGFTRLRKKRASTVITTVLTQRQRRAAVNASMAKRRYTKRYRKKRGTRRGRRRRTTGRGLTIRGNRRSVYRRECIISWNTPVSASDTPTKLDFSLKDAMGTAIRQIDQNYDEFKIVKAQLYLTGFVERLLDDPNYKPPYNKGSLQGVILTVNDISPNVKPIPLVGMHQMAGVRLT
ncbi:hypothetical protein DPMN_037849 [Dreissena polymorpha]|uniref:Uncharacterized protein n=1 Tax=Dreissena polymorpha TaxID=45954 RepID=A0A9D4MFU9_DREPO|nr:hypothetical protein DPMN_037849 [Dreissena polymorpha]